MTKYIFPLLSKHCDRGYRILFSKKQKQKKKKNIISRVISSHMGPMFIDTADINGLHLFWDSFKWFCLLISNEEKYFSYFVQNIVVIVYYFQMWNKKERIIISRVISSHMVPTYIETPYIIRLVLNPERVNPT